jgi:excisionase family DNA binding protein
MMNGEPRTNSLSGVEQQQVKTLERLLLGGGVPALVSPAGERVELPGRVFEILKEAVGFISHGQAIALVPDCQVVTTQRAADILGMSRPFLVNLLESGVIAYHKVGNQRRVTLRNVQEFAKKRDQERAAALDRLSRDAFEAGLYDRNEFPQGGTDR